MLLLEGEKVLLAGTHQKMLKYIFDFYVLTQICKRVKIIGSNLTETWQYKPELDPSTNLI